MSRRMPQRRALAAALALLASASAAPAQDGGGGGVPQAIQGPWFQGDCAQPSAMLHVTARAAARVPQGDAAASPAMLRRFVAVRVSGDWTIGTGAGAEAPRLLLRSPGPGALETAEPEAKTRDDRLPGPGIAVQRWQRCPAVPLAVAAAHGEGVAMLAALEHLEAACHGGEDAAGCVGAIVVQGDVSGDGLLGAAEVARMLRGMAWVAALAGPVPAAEAPAVAPAAAQGLGALAALAAARGVVESLDFDGDGRLSPAELARDRARFGTASGTEAGRAAAGLPALPGLDEALRALAGTGARSPLLPAASPARN